MKKLIIPILMLTAAANSADYRLYKAPEDRGPIDPSIYEPASPEDLGSGITLGICSDTLDRAGRTNIYWLHLHKRLPESLLKFSRHFEEDCRQFLVNMDSGAPEGYENWFEACGHAIKYGGLIRVVLGAHKLEPNESTNEAKKLAEACKKIFAEWDKEEPEYVQSKRPKTQDKLNTLP